MKKIISLVSVLAAFMATGVYADNEIKSTFVEGSTGTTSATAVIPPAAGFGLVTDLATQVDAGATSPTVDIRVGTAKKSVTSATTAGTVVYFDNAASILAVGGYALVKGTTAGTYQIQRIMAAATTSVTVNTTLPNLTTADSIWALKTAVRRPASMSQTAQTGFNIYVPSDMPAALTLDGNTTSCKISVSGVRTSYK